MIDGKIVVTSLAELFKVLVSQPPVTEAVLVMMPEH
jgi:hypothetical protein